MCSCNEGYEGAYCEVAAISTSELPLLVSLSTLLPMAAVLVVIISIVFIYRRLKPSEDVGISHQHRNNVRTRYDTFSSLGYILCSAVVISSVSPFTVRFTVQKQSDICL